MSEYEQQQTRLFGWNDGAGCWSRVISSRSVSSYSLSLSLSLSFIPTSEFWLGVNCLCLCRFFFHFSPFDMKKSCSFFSQLVATICLSTKRSVRTISQQVFQRFLIHFCSFHVAQTDSSRSRSWSPKSPSFFYRKKLDRIFWARSNGFLAEFFIVCRNRFSRALCCDFDCAVFAVTETQNPRRVHLSRRVLFPILPISIPGFVSMRVTAAIVYLLFFFISVVVFVARPRLWRHSIAIPLGSVSRIFFSTRFSIEAPTRTETIDVDFAPNYRVFPLKTRKWETWNEFDSKLAPNAVSLEETTAGVDGQQLAAGKGKKTRIRSNVFSYCVFLVRTKEKKTPDLLFPFFVSSDRSARFICDRQDWFGRIKKRESNTTLILGFVSDRKRNETNRPTRESDAIGCDWPDWRWNGSGGGGGGVSVVWRLDRLGFGCDSRETDGDRNLGPLPRPWSDAAPLGAKLN